MNPETGDVITTLLRMLKESVVPARHLQADIEMTISSVCYTCDETVSSPVENKSLNYFNVEALHDPHTASRCDQSSLARLVACNDAH